MGGVLSRSVELVNETSPGVVLEITEVEGNERRGRLILRLGPWESREIKGRKFINRSLIARTHRSIHVTPVPPGIEPKTLIFRANYFAENGKVIEPKTLIFRANYFAENGKVIFRLVEGELRADPVVISNFRRLRFFACAGGH